MIFERLRKALTPASGLEVDEDCFAVLLPSDKRKGEVVPTGFWGLEVLPSGLAVQRVRSGEVLKPSAEGQAQNAGLWFLAKGPWVVEFIPQAQHAPELAMEAKLILDLAHNSLLPEFLAQQRDSMALDELILLLEEIANSEAMLPAMTPAEDHAYYLRFCSELLERTGLGCTGLKRISSIGVAEGLASQLALQWQSALDGQESVALWQLTPSAQGVMQETLKQMPKHEAEQDKAQEAEQADNQAVNQAVKQARLTTDDVMELSGVAVELGLSPKRYPSQWWRPTALDEALRLQVSRSLDRHSATLSNWRREQSSALTDALWHDCGNLQEEMQLLAQRLVLLPPLTASGSSYRNRRYIARLIREVKDRESDIASTLKAMMGASNDEAQIQLQLQQITVFITNLQALLQQRTSEVLDD